MRNELHDETAIIQDFELTTDCSCALDMALKIAMLRYSTLSHYRVFTRDTSKLRSSFFDAQNKNKNEISENTIEFYWVEDKNVKDLQKLPFTLTTNNIVNFVNSWLDTVPENKKELDYNDGDSYGAGVQIRSKNDCSRVAFTVTAMSLYYSK